jgi:DNA-binding GntR family transcriptional regulator
MRLFHVFWVSLWGLEIDAIRGSDPQAEIKAHHAILEAVKTRDTDLARGQLIRHFDDVKTRIAQYRQSGGSK